MDKSTFHIDICSELPKSVFFGQGISPVTGDIAPFSICGYCGTKVFHPNGYNGYVYKDKFSKGQCLDRAKYKLPQENKDEV